MPELDCSGTCLSKLACYNYFIAILASTLQKVDKSIRHNGGHIGIAVYFVRFLK